MTDQDRPPLCLVEGFNHARDATEACLFDYPHPSSQHSWEITLYSNPKRRSIRVAAPIRRCDKSPLFRPDERAEDECHLCLDPEAELIGIFPDNNGAVHHVHKLRNMNYVPPGTHAASEPDPTPSR